MAIAPNPPKQWQCRHCHWRQSALMHSDVLLPKPQQCPECGGEVVLKDAGWLERIKNHLQLR